MDGIWRSAPAPALRIWWHESPPRWLPNDAAIGWATVLGLDAGFWPRLVDQAQQQRGLSAAGTFVAGGHPEASFRRVDLDDGVLLWIEPTSPGLGESLAERTLLVASSIGVGFWSRDLDTGATLWDA